MSKELKPCPFCGGKVTAIETYPGRGEIYCGKCDIVMGSCEAMTAEELTRAWNTRVEPITLMSPITTVSEGEPQTYVPLRTCRNVLAGKIAFFRCSECGEESDVHTFEGGPHVNYCPGCGAKVVEE